jgi:hypothetical protein
VSARDAGWFRESRCHAPQPCIRRDLSCTTAVLQGGSVMHHTRASGAAVINHSRASRGCRDAPQPCIAERSSCTTRGARQQASNMHCSRARFMHGCGATKQNTPTKPNSVMHASVQDGRTLCPNLTTTQVGSTSNRGNPLTARAERGAARAPLMEGAAKRPERKRRLRGRKATLAGVPRVG